MKCQSKTSGNGMAKSVAKSENVDNGGDRKKIEKA
jgi:hypothetical protein